MSSSDSGRRTFLGFCTAGLGAIFTGILGVPMASYLIDARHRRAASGAYKLIDGVRLDEVNAAPPNRPVQGVIRDVRRDAWTLHPNDVVGRVWVIRKGDAPANLAGMTDAQVADFNKPENRAAREQYLLVFTTICPHLGCSVNLNSSGDAFACPCHAAEFSTSGDRVHPEHNPAARGMDTLDWQIDPTDSAHSRLLVKYETFKSSTAAKEVL